MNNDGNENEMNVANNYVTDAQITAHRWSPIEEVPAIFFAKVGAAVMLNRKRLCRFPFLLDNNTMAYSLGKDQWDADFAKALFETVDLTSLVQVGALPSYNAGDVEAMEIMLPDVSEQHQIGAYFRQLNNLITLHQCKHIGLFLAFLMILVKNTITWEQRKLSSLCDKFTDGDWIESKDQSDSGVRLVQTGNIGVAEYLDKPNNKKWISDETFDRLHCEEVLPGDILISRLPEPAGRACIMPFLGTKMITAVDCTIVRTAADVSNKFLVQYLSSQAYFDAVNTCLAGGTRQRISRSNLADFDVPIPIQKAEQEAVGTFFEGLDDLITLHQREQLNTNKEAFMLNQAKSTDLFYDYYMQWVHIYKEGSIRKVTLDKYMLTLSWLEKLIPEIKLCEMTRLTYQKLLNDYAKTHERQTTMDFHHQLKGAILDAVDEGLIERDPTRKVIIKGKNPSEKKIKYLNQFELHTLLTNLNLSREINWDWFILLVAKTGIRFSEALALTPRDFDFPHQTLSINKTWDYKGAGGFLPTKNKSSIRKVQIDWQTVAQFSELIKGLPDDKPIFVKEDGKVYNSTVNDILERHCLRASIPVISVHGLRHTHASLLLFAGVSIGSVARRLGHSSMTTTQKTYLHIIHELESQDVDIVMRSLSSLS